MGSRVPMHRKPIPMPPVKPPRNSGNDRLYKSIKAICDYCMHVAKTYRFNMEPNFDSDELNPLSNNVVFRFKAPSHDGTNVIWYIMAISDDMSPEYTVERVKDFADDDVFRNYNDIKTYNGIVKSMMGAVDYSLAGCDRPTNVAGIIYQKVTPLPIKTERY